MFYKFQPIAIANINTVYTYELVYMHMRMRICMPTSTKLNQNI